MDERYRLKKVLKLAKKTGDRIVVFDNDEPESSYVVMDLQEYEGLWEKNKKTPVNVEKVPLTGEKIIDNIKHSVDTPNQVPESFPKENLYSSGQVLKNRFKNNNWQIPEDRRGKGIDEVIDTE
jgi:hypothetical protein